MSVAAICPPRNLFSTSTTGIRDLAAYIPAVRPTSPPPRMMISVSIRCRSPIFLVVVSFEQTTENPFLLWFEWRHAQLFSDLSNYLLLGNIRAFCHNLFVNHDCRGARQLRISPFIGPVFSERL